MEPIEILYIAFSITLTGAGLSLVGFSMRAYQRTSHESMLRLCIGFTLIVGAAIATTISAFYHNFEQTRLLLTVNYSISTIGFLFVIYSIAGSE